MIFVTVGTQLPFDRLIKAVDQWAARNNRSDVFAQIGPENAYRPRHIQWAHFVAAPECRRWVERADLVVSHAGMGTIISALELGKPLIVMPRRCDLHEHRNDHQSATVARLGARASVKVALDSDSLEKSLDELANLKTTQPITRSASPQLLHAIRRFINNPGVELPAGERVLATE